MLQRICIWDLPESTEPVEDASWELGTALTTKEIL
jgi:hypothetical protein